MACVVGTANFADKNVGNGKTVTATGITLTGTTAGNYQLSSTTATTTANITARALTVTAATNTKTYDATTSAAATPTITSGALQDSETANFTEVYNNKNVGTGKTLIPSGTVNDGNGGNNYTYTFVNNTTGVITARALTITAAPNTKTYDGTTSAAATPTTSGLQTGDTVTGLSEAYDTKNAGTGKTLSVSAGYTVNDGNSGGNYTVTTVTNTTGVINKATLTITAVTNTKTYDATTTAAATPTTSGVQTGDTVTGLSETYDTANAGTGKTLSVATFTVNDGNSGGNYTVSLVTNTTGAINPATPGVLDSGPNSSTYGQSVTLSVTVTPPSGGVPTGTVTFSFIQNSTTYYVCSDGSVSTTLCSVGVTNNVASVTTRNLPPGMDGITATYSGDSNFNGGNANNLAVTVSKADTATTISKSIDPSVYGDTVALTVRVKDNTTNSTGVPTGTVTLSFKLDAGDPNTYSICADGSVPTVPCSLAQTLTLSPDNSDPQGKTAKVTVNTSRLPAGLTADAFTYAINASYAGDTNFKPSGPVGLTQKVNQRPITVTAVASTKTYDGNTSSTGTPTITSGTLANGDTANFTQSFDTRNAGTGKTLTPAGSVNDGQDGNNYAATFVHVTTGVINPLAITVTAVADTKTFDGNTSSTGAPTIAPALISPDTSGFIQTFDNRNAGTNKTLTPSGTANDGNNGSNYSVTFASVNTGTINPLAITVTAVTSTKTYDGNTSSTGVPTIAPPLISPDSPNFTQTFDTRNAGTNKKLTPAGSVSDGNSGNNYSVTFVSVTTGTINPLAITVTAVASTKTYDGNTSSTGVPAIAPALINPDTSDFIQTFDTRNAGTNKKLTPSGTANDGNSGNNYSATFVSVTTGTINPLAITVTAVTSTKTYDGNTSSTGVPTIAPPLVGGDTSGFTQTFDTRNAGTNKKLTPAGSVSDGNSGNNYSVTFVSVTTGTINPLAITVTAVASTKTYDGNTSSTGVPTIAPPLISPDSPNFSQTFDNRNAGTNKTLTPAGSVNDGNSGNNYAITFVSVVTGTINPLAITVTAVTDTKTYEGNTNSTGVPTIAPPLISPDSPSFTQTFDTRNAGTNKKLTPAGSVNDGNSGHNYAITFVSVATGTINPLAITVTAVADTKTYDGNTNSTGVPTIAPALISPDTSGFIQKFDNRNAGMGKTLTPSGSVNDSNGGNNYAVTFTSVNTGKINPLGITVTAVTETRVYDGTTSSSGVPTIAPPLISPDAPGFTQKFDSKNAGARTLILSGSMNDGNTGNNYSVTFVNVAGTITQRPLTVSATGHDKGYDGLTTATVTLSDNRVLNDVFTDSYASANFVDKNVGNGKTVNVGGISIAGLDAPNYTFNTTTATTATITPRPLTVTATGVNRVYDSTTAATVTLADNRVSGDTWTDSYTNASFDTKNMGTGKTVTVYGISISGPDAGNYSVNTGTTTTANITPAPLTITAVTNTKTYDATTSAAAPPVVTGLQGGDMATATETYDTKNAGSGKTLSVATYMVNDGNSGGNYTVTKVANTTGVINKAALTVTATGMNKMYDATTNAAVTLSDNHIAGDSVTDSYTSASFGNPNVGTWSVSVSGISTAGTDAPNYAFNTTAMTTASITPAPTTTMLASGLIQPMTAPATVKFTATVTSPTVIPVGTVTFTDTSTNSVLGGGPVSLNSGIATVTTKSLAVGQHLVSVTYTPASPPSPPDFVTSNSAANTAPAVTITGPASGDVQAVNTVVNFSATFTDPGMPSPSAQWSFDTTGSTNGVVGVGTVTGTYTFSAAGVYGVALAFSDGLGGVTIANTDSSPNAPPNLPAQVVIYDPSAGFVTGGGWIDSPAGAYAANVTLIGKASFGFVSKYQKGATVPTGNTEFQFQVANFNFHSTSYDWLVIGGAKAQYKGSGTINGAGNYSFMLTAVDGALKGGNAPDTFRMKIWDPVTSASIYDNMLGATDSSDPTTVLGGGSIVIHTK